MGSISAWTRGSSTYTSIMRNRAIPQRRKVDLYGRRKCRRIEGLFQELLSPTPTDWFNGLWSQEKQDAHLWMNFEYKHDHTVKHCQEHTSQKQREQDNPHHTKRIASNGFFIVTEIDEIQPTRSWWAIEIAAQKEITHSRIAVYAQWYANEYK